MTTQPITLGLTPSFGFGDRIGLATPGHVAAMREAGDGIAPIFPQQSIREMTRTGRTAPQVMREALAGMELAGWDGLTGADADHLKTAADVDQTLAAGFTFFTIDPSDHVDAGAHHYDAGELVQRFEQVRDRIGWVEAYSGQSIALDTGATIELDEQSCLRAGVKYGLAVEHCAEMVAHIRAVAGDRPFEIELSVDETDEPTTLAEHWIIASECRRREVAVTSLAPRFIGDFEKGVDFKGDLGALERSLADHAEIARRLGPYKLSLHSGSDKLSMYTMLARATEGRFHVKTAGTSYLEALRVAARHDEPLFRRIVAFAREHYEADRATYHVSATLDERAPDAISTADGLEAAYLERWCDVPEGVGFTAPGRQILHCTFGSVLRDADLGPALRSVLEDHPGSYAEVLCEHFARHLRALQAGLA